jgi:hypothetical protein
MNTFWVKDTDGEITHWCGGTEGKSNTGRDLKPWERKDELSYWFQKTKETKDENEIVIKIECMACGLEYTKEDEKNILLMGSD